MIGESIFNDNSKHLLKKIPIVLSENLFKTHSLN